MNSSTNVPEKRSRIRRIGPGVLLLALLGYAGLCVALATLQDTLVFHPKPGAGADPSSRRLPFRDLRLTADDGIELHAWYLPVTAPHGRHVLFLHGNAGNLSNRLHTLEVLHRLEHPVLIIDYRGYGLSDGVPSEAGLVLDARAAWHYLTETLGVAPADIVIYGRSLGGAVAAQLAGGVEPHALVLESTFSRLRDMAGHRYPFVPVDWLLRIEFDSVAALRDFSRPVLVAHSPSDTTVPFALGRRLATSLAAPVRFVKLSGSHNRAFRLGGPEYHQSLSAFIGTPD